MTRILLPAIVALLVSGQAWSAGYECPVSHKVDGQRIYPQDNLDKNKPSVKIEDRGTSFSHCLLPGILAL